MRHVFTGFGFGPIQAGLFVAEAFRCGRFDRIVISEIDSALVQAVRQNRGSYSVNVARTDGIETARIDGVELLNPGDPADRSRLINALSDSTEIATSLPSVSFFTAGNDNSVAALIAEAIRNRRSPASIVYAAENNNHAAEILQKNVSDYLKAPMPTNLQFLNTVIGKMSQVVTDPQIIDEMNLTPIAPGLDKAFLVEAFNRILVTRTTVPDFGPGIDVFVEKDDLLAFEEAKLYGHNAIHALLAFLADLRGLSRMTEVADDPQIMDIARRAFLDESGAALVRKYRHLGDELFTESGYRAYAEDLLIRMTNPWLNDTVQRAARDPIRKLGVTDRIFGTMSLALQNGIIPRNMAIGALAGVAGIMNKPDLCRLPVPFRGINWCQIAKNQLAGILQWIWDTPINDTTNPILNVTYLAQEDLLSLFKA